jgi:SnoaL-like polyketide cyclase
MADLTDAQFVHDPGIGATGACRCGTDPEGLMVSDEQEVTDSLTAAFNAHDLEAATELFHPRACYVCPGGVAEGREEIASYLALYLEGFPEIAVTPHSKAVLADIVVIEWTFTGIHTGPLLLPSGDMAEPTGRRIAVRGCDVRTMHDGLITSQRVYYDQLEMLTQLGIPCTPP